MPNNIFKVICGKITVETARSGSFLFKRGDTNSDLVYLLKGDISLEVAPLKIEVIKAGSESALFAIAHQFPRKVDAVAKGEVYFLRLNTIFLNPPDAKELGKKEHQEIQEAKKADSVDCLATLLMIPIIRSLPPANLHKVSQELEEVRVKKDEFIIQQGAFGDYYYLIKTGECLVTHKNSEHAQAIKVAKLQVWNTFGETALISGEPRAETVTALSDMTLLRLHKDKFLKLIKEPSLSFIDFIELELWEDKGAVLLDIRPPDEYEKYHLANAINTPLFTLRMQLDSLDKNKLYIIVCNDGKSSESAAFLMKTYSFKVKIIRKGLDYVPKGALLENQPLLIKNEIAKTKVLIEKTRPSLNSDSISDSKKTDNTLSHENKKLRFVLAELKLKYVKIEKENQEWEKKYNALLSQVVESKFKKKE
jgi:CRP-like cAMP-binding protein